MSSSTRSRLRRSAVAALSIVLVFGAVSCGSEDRGGQQTAEHGADALHADDPDADRIVDVVRNKLAELDLSGAVFGVWRGDEEIVSGAVGSRHWRSRDA